MIYNLETPNLSTMLNLTSQQNVIEQTQYNNINK